ncbi:MAG: phosphopyruvate hydratase [Archaeoglobaceae archaeon]|nr:enolase [Archaeoglobaceae archaeon]MDW7989133.1 phosphopyruvate hydratase [Archaeoglobaceae archaeon]
MIIEDVRYRIVFDSRGKETIECEVEAEDFIAIASAPSGASTGSKEVLAVETRRYKEIEEKISKALIGMSVFDQEGVDETLREIDGTENFSNIGGNFAVSASIAVAKCASLILEQPLCIYLGGAFAREIPFPLGNVIGGGKHAEGSTSIQEFLVIPVGAKSFFEAQKINSEVHKEVGNLLRKRGIFTAKGDEGAWAAQISDDFAFEILSEVVDRVEKNFGTKIRIGIDFAASELWNGEKYVYGDKKLNSDEQINFVAELVEKFDLFYVEDPLHEEDFEGFSKLTKEVDCMICGDDIFVTNWKRVEKAVRMKSGNTLLVKPNQIGTLTETTKAVKIAKRGGYEIVVSHRSGETEDNYLPHLAIAFNAKLIKTGVVGGERIAKLNEMIRIEELLRAKMVRI